MSTSKKQTASSAAESSGRATDGFSLLGAITRAFKMAGLAAVVWSWGYMGFSVAWLYVALFFHIISEEYRKIKDSKKAFAQRSLVDEKKAILSMLDEYPSWVYFPQAEKAEWFNKIMTQMWPYIGEYVEGLLRTTIQPTIQGSLPSKFQNFSFGTIDLGDTSPSIDHIVIYQDVLLQDEIVCDVEFRYNGDAIVKVNVNGISAGIKHISVSGKMRAVMKPLVSQVPIIGAVTVFFLNRPKVNFDLTEAANILDSPLLNTSLRGIVEEQIAHYFVLPNRIPVALVPGIDISKLKHPVPKGVVHVQVLEARNLRGADTSLTGRARSDPYCIIQVGAKALRTKTVKKTLSPVWNEHFEMIIDQTFGHVINIDVKDEDRIDRDDSLGMMNLNVETVVNKKSLDMWRKLEGASTGSIHLMATWFYLCADIQEMKKRRDVASKTRKTFEETLSCAVLLFVLEEANNVSPTGKSGSPHSLFAKITVGHDVQQSSVQYKTNQPRWDENFQFFVDDPETRPITIELYHRGSTKEKKLGAVTLPVNVVLTADNMTVVKHIPMPDVSPSCTLTVHFTLRIMMQNITKECIQKTDLDMTEDSLLLNTSGNNNTDMMVLDTSGNNNTDALATPESATAESATPQSASRKTEIDDRGMTDSHTASAGELLAPQSATVGTEAMESKQSVSSTLATPSSTDSHPFGEIELTVQYSTQHDHLVVVIHQCRNLIPCDKDSLADPYVRVYVMPDHSSKTKRKTELVKNSLNPVFDETFEWPMTLAEAQSSALDIAVKNDVGLFSSSRTEMGRVVVNLSDVGEISQREWYELSECQK